MSRQGLLAALQDESKPDALGYRDDRAPGPLLAAQAEMDAAFGRGTLARSVGTLFEPGADLAVTHGVLQSADGSHRSLYVRVWSRDRRRWQVAIDDEFAATPLDDDNTLVAQARAREAELMREAEQFFRHDTREDHKQALKAIRLHESVDVEATEGKTALGEARVDRRAALGEFADTTITLTPLEANQRFPLVEFLTGRMLPGPASVDLDGLALTLDPRNKLYYARGALCIFEDGCRRSVRRGDWRGLTAMEFAEIRKSVEARPYAELIWLCVYANDSTRPACELDDELRYRLTQTLDLARDFPRAARVAQELAKGCTLSAAANLARVPLAEARRVAAAFDAVSFLVPD